MPSTRSILAYIGILVLLFVFATISESRYAPDKSSDPEQRTTNTNSEAEPEQSVTTPSPPAIAQGSSQQRSADNPNNKEKKPVEELWVFWGDGAAQWIMAVFGVIATGVSICAVYLLNGTLRETRKAVAAAETANTSMLEAAHLQLRPWVTISGIGRVRFENGLVIFGFKCCNSGQSPALNTKKTRVSFITSIDDGLKEILHKVENQSPPISAFLATVGPGEVFFVDIPVESSEFFELVCTNQPNPRGVVVAKIHITYERAPKGAECETVGTYRFRYQGSHADFICMQDTHIDRMMVHPIGTHIAT